MYVFFFRYFVTFCSVCCWGFEVQTVTKRIRLQINMTFCYFFVTV